VALRASVGDLWRADVALCFARVTAGPSEIAHAVVDLVASSAADRNLARFGSLGVLLAPDLRQAVSRSHPELMDADGVRCQVDVLRVQVVHSCFSSRRRRW